jgi:DNA invertase Pin-like site-specific DNA recombinase
MRAAIYARYSSDLQSESSIDDQVRLCREWVAKEKGSIGPVYTDYAISGGALRNRAGIQALLDGAKQGGFDVVVAEALDRVSRDQEDIAAIYKRLTHANVRIDRHSGGRIDQRAPYRPQGHDERAVP